jgi:antirestriction protein ArdC
LRPIWLCALICLPLKHLRITSGYGYRIHPLSGKYALHVGIDLRARHDTVFAVMDGRVSVTSYNSTIGYYVRIDHSGITSTYGHLSKILVMATDTVAAGQPIAVTGATGRVTGEHLHFCIRLNGRSIDPIKFLYQILINKTMANNLKSLPELVANKLASDLKNGTSFLQKPVKDNGNPAFVLPVNANSGKGYSALNAVNLAMRGHDDPRWLSAKEASFTGYVVKAGSKATMISFLKDNDIQAIRDHTGGKMLDEEGKTQVRVVEYEKPRNATFFLFNAEQINRIPPLEEFLAKNKPETDLSPVEKVEKLIAERKAVVVHGGQEAFYDKVKDEIHLPEKEQFENETAYAQAAVHQLAHWSGHESRLNRPMEGNFGSLAYAREEIRAAIGAAMIGAELEVGHNFPHHAAYSGTWAKMLKDEPFEMFRIANDAQKISDKVLGVNRTREQEQAPVPEEKKEFKKGDEIGYNDMLYKVLEVHKNSNIKVEDQQGSKNVFKPTDGIYNSLLDVKYAPKQNALEASESQEQEQGAKIGR